MVRTINKLEKCAALGMITENQAQRLAEAGLYAYNHNLDTSEEYYKEVISTRGFEDRLQTIENVRKTNVTVCSGGIIGMGRALKTERNARGTFHIKPATRIVPINALVPVEGTPMEEAKPVEIWEMIRMVAATRIIMPETQVRLSAGRMNMSREGQAMCFWGQFNFAGDKLLTTPNPDVNDDMEMFEMLGLTPQNHLQKFLSLLQLKLRALNLPLLEKTKMVKTRTYN
jgi:biotin synthase